jgi:hypothetical protein
MRQSWYTDFFRLQYRELICIRSVWNQHTSHNTWYCAPGLPLGERDCQRIFESRTSGNDGLPYRHSALRRGNSYGVNMKPFLACCALLQS